MTYVLYLSLFGIPNWQLSVNITIQSSLTFSFENKLNIWLVPIFILVLSGKHAAGQLQHDGTSGGGTERKNGKKVRNCVDYMPNASVLRLCIPNKK